jgi:DNA-binding transcriptional LysR family regulator
MDLQETAKFAKDTCMKSKLPLSQFRMSSEDCELLLAFGEGGTLSDLAELMGRDISVISRQMKRLAGASPVLEKRAGRWRMTVAGENIAKWTREAMRAQSGILDEQSTVAIVTTHEFGARILTPGLGSLLPNPRVLPSILCTDLSIEPRILSGEAEFGFDCGRPQSPLIKYKLVRDEPLSLLASPVFKEHYRLKNWKELIETPYVEYSRISPTRSLGLKSEISVRAGSFNTVAATRAAVLAGRGWSILPKYSVSHELEMGSLVSFLPEAITHEQFGVWWLRGNERAQRDWVPRATKWLKSQDLG